MEGYTDGRGRHSGRVGALDVRMACGKKVCMHRVYMHSLYISVHTCECEGYIYIYI